MNTTESITTSLHTLKTGDKVWFEGEKQGYTVQARSDSYIVCTKPFNAQNTVLYTIIDTEEGIRGTENLIFCGGFETKEDCDEALERLEKGVSEVSHRNRVELKITKVRQLPNPALAAKVGL
jgi:hypothetical protein